MSELGDAIDEVRAELDDSASEFMADVCDIVLLTPSNDDSGGFGDSSSTVVSDVPCSYEPLQPLDRQTGGRVLTGLTHKVTLPANSNTLAILPKHKIVVDARGGSPSLTFQDPVVLNDSLGPFVEVAAMLAEQ